MALPACQCVKLKEREKIDKYFELVRGLKKLWNKKVTIITLVIGAIGTVTKGLISTKNGGPRNNRTRGFYPNYYILEIGQIQRKTQES